MNESSPSSHFHHIYASVCTSYAAVCTNYALFCQSEKSIKSRAESTCKKPYALYAPLLGVGPFSAFFLLREVHTVHTTAYGSRWNRAFALLSVGIGTLPARQNQKCIRRCIRLFGRETPIGPLSTEYPKSGYRDIRIPRPIPRVTGESSPPVTR